MPVAGQAENFVKENEDAQTMAPHALSAIAKRSRRNGDHRL